VVVVAVLGYQQFTCQHTRFRAPDLLQYLSAKQYRGSC